MAWSLEWAVYMLTFVCSILAVALILALLRIGKMELRNEREDRDDTDTPRRD